MYTGGVTGSKLPLVTLLILAAIAAVLSASTALGGGNSGPIGAGGGHSCAVTSTGGAKCWGENDDGQLGNGSNVGSMTPVDVTSLTSGVESISGGGSFTCALTTAGAVKCWGRNASGQLGDGTRTSRTTPVQVSGLAGGAAEISAGVSHACALLTNGAVKCWGNNSFGQLGDGTTSSSVTNTPVDADLPEGATAIATGSLFTCALTTVGGVKCWGDNVFGQLGDGTIEQRSLPAQVSGLTSGVGGIGAGGGGSFGHACALLAAGGAMCWGNNEYGQLGDDRDCRNPEVCSIPIAVLDISEHLSAISGGSLFTCALTDGGAVKCWGHNDVGQLGDGLSCGGLCGRPLNVIGLSSGVTAIATGSSHACASLAAGIRCWGNNFDGQAGDGGKCGTSCPSPVDVIGLSGGANGDVNCDHNVNSIDAALVLQLGAGLLSSLTCGAAADTNHDGQVNAIDAALILQYSAGLLTSLP